MNWPDDKLSRFEAARLIGARALQVALGAPVLVKTDKSNPTEIAKLEFREKMIPMTIKRRLPNGKHIVVQVKKAVEDWLANQNGEI